MPLFFIWVNKPAGITGRQRASSFALGFQHPPGMLLKELDSERMEYGNQAVGIYMAPPRMGGLLEMAGNPLLAQPSSLELCSCGCPSSDFSPPEWTPSCLLTLKLTRSSSLDAPLIRALSLQWGPVKERCVGIF